MSTAYRATSRRERRRRDRLRWWNRFVLLIGYAAILYEVSRGVVYLLVLLGGNA